MLVVFWQGGLVGAVQGALSGCLLHGQCMHMHAPRARWAASRACTPEGSSYRPKAHNPHHPFGVRCTNVCYVIERPQEASHRPPTNRNDGSTRSKRGVQWCWLCVLLSNFTPVWCQKSKDVGQSWVLLWVCLLPPGRQWRPGRRQYSSFVALEGPVAAAGAVMRGGRGCTPVTPPDPMLGP